MNSPKHCYGIIIVTLIFSSLLFAQQRDWSQHENQKSPYEVYLEVQDENNRITNKTSQRWNSSSSAWENDGQSVYEYAASGNYELAYYYYYFYYTGIWIPGYYYYYYYNAMGYLTGYDYYGWSNDAWAMYGSGAYSDHNSWGDWGTYTYTNIDPASGRESYQQSRYFDGSGNVTDVYHSWWDGSSYNNLWWGNTTWYNGYYESKTSYDWNNGWVANERTNYTYGNGYGSQVGQSYPYLYGGSPSSWTRYMWSNNAWNPYRHCSYGTQNGYTSMATYYDTYDSATNAWSNYYYRAYYYYYGGYPKMTSQLDISDSRLKLVERAEPGADAGEWDNTSRVWISYENDGNKVGTENEASIPNNFSLEQNYPNPFNPETTINFTLAENSDVKLSIYDMTGRLINELVNTDMIIGNHSVDWNGLDINGNHVGTGIYLYKLQTDKFTKTKKMILLR